VVALSPVALSWLRYRHQSALAVPLRSNLRLIGVFSYYPAGVVSDGGQREFLTSCQKASRSWGRQANSALSAGVDVIGGTGETASLSAGEKASVIVGRDLALSSGQTGRAGIIVGQDSTLSSGLAGRAASLGGGDGTLP
jgi:hypothetical protein